MEFFQKYTLAAAMNHLVPPPQLSTARIAALLLRSFSFVSVTTNQKKACFDALRDIIYSKVSLFFCLPRDAARKPAVMSECFCHLPSPIKIQRNSVH